MKFLWVFTVLASFGYVLANNAPLVQVNIQGDPNCYGNNCNNDGNTGNTGANTGDDGDDGTDTGNDDTDNGNDDNDNDNDPGTDPDDDGNNDANDGDDDVALPPGGVRTGSSSDYCFAEVDDTCAANQNNVICQSSYGDFSPLASDFSKLVRTQLKHNYEYLMLYIHYSNYLINRKGFAETFKTLANYKWDLAKYTISYITERGGVMDFSVPEPPCSCSCSSSCSHSDSSSSDSSDDVHSMLNELIGGGGEVETPGGGSVSPGDGEYAGNADGYELPEVLALAFSADIEKQTAIDADQLHALAIGQTGHDVQSALYLQETYIRPHRKIVGNLVRRVNILSQMMTFVDQMIALYHFDDLIWSLDIFD